MPPPTPNQMMVSVTNEIGGTKRKNSMYGSSSRRMKAKRPITSPIGTPTSMPRPQPIRMRRAESMVDEASVPSAASSRNAFQASAGDGKK